jgi:hypothetical protein
MRTMLDDWRWSGPVHIDIAVILQDELKISRLYITAGNAGCRVRTSAHRLLGNSIKISTFNISYGSYLLNSA